MTKRFLFSGFGQCGALLLGLGGLATTASAQTAVTFANAAAYASGGAGVYAVAAQDLNADGKPDIVVANANSSTVGVLLNSGTGTFPATLATYASGPSGSGPYGSGPYGVAIGDLNGDNRPDIAVVNNFNGTVGVLLNSGTGTFPATATTYSTGSDFASPSALVLADLNGDGRLDIAVANASAGTVSVLLGRSTGGFAAATPYAAPGGSARSLATGDVNGDGKADLVFGSSDGVVGVLLNNGSGSFPATPLVYAAGSTGIVSDVKVGDINSDGKADIVAANYDAGTVGVLLGSGTGTFPTAAATYATGTGIPSGVSSIALADLNKDGRLDIAAANYNLNSAGVLLGRSAGGFTPVSTFSFGNSIAPNSVAVADLNGDTKLDIVTANFTANRIGVLLNTSVLAAKSALGTTAVALYPNPAHEAFAVQVPGVAGATAVQADLLNALGQQVSSQTAALPATGTRLTVNTTALAAGVYTLRLRAATETAVQRVVLY